MKKEVILELLNEGFDSKDEVVREVIAREVRLPNLDINFFIRLVGIKDENVLSLYPNAFLKVYDFIRNNEHYAILKRYLFEGLSKEKFNQFIANSFDKNLIMIAMEKGDFELVKDILFDKRYAPVAGVDEIVEIFAKLVASNPELSVNDIEFIRYVDNYMGIEVPEKYKNIVELCNGNDFTTKISAKIEELQNEEIANANAENVRANAGVQRMLLGNQGIHGHAYAGRDAVQRVDLDGQGKNIVRTLRQNYRNSCNINAELGSLGNYMNDLYRRSNDPNYNGPSAQKIRDAQRAFDYINRRYNIGQDSVKNIMALVWHASNDVAKLTGEYAQGDNASNSNNLKEAIIEALATIANAYPGRPNPFSCVGGSKNNLVFALDKYYEGIEIDYGFNQGEGIEKLSYEMLYNKFQARIIEIIPADKREEMFLSYDNSMGKTLVDQNEEWLAILKKVEEEFLKEYKYSRHEFIKLFANKDALEIQPLRLIKDKMDIYSLYLDFCAGLNRVENITCLSRPKDFEIDFIHYLGVNYSISMENAEIAAHALNFLTPKELKKADISRKVKDFAKQYSNENMVIFIRNFAQNSELQDEFLNDFSNYLERSYPELKEFFDGNEEELRNPLISCVADMFVINRFDKEKAVSDEVKLILQRFADSNKTQAVVMAKELSEKIFEYNDILNLPLNESEYRSIFEGIAKDFLRDPESMFEKVFNYIKCLIGIEKEAIPQEQIEQAQNLLTTSIVQIVV